MTSKKLFSAIFIFLFMFCFMNLVNAADFTPQGNINLRNVYNITNVPEYNGTNINITGNYHGNGSLLTGILTSVNEANLNVNSSDFWDNLDTINSSQMEDSGGTLNILESWFTSLWNTILGTKTTDDLNQGTTNLYDNQTWNESHADSLYVDVAGDTMTGNLDINGNLTVGTNTLFVNPTLGAVGIDTNTLTGDLTFGDNLSAITMDTSDGSDTKELIISGGGGLNTLRGATITLRGNENPADPGELWLRGGFFNKYVMLNDFLYAFVDGVGIGTFTPTHELNVVGDANITGTLYYGALDGEANLNVNRSSFWDNLNSPSDINTSDITDDNTYVQVVGDVMTGGLNISVSNIVDALNIKLGSIEYLSILSYSDDGVHMSIGDSSLTNSNLILTRESNRAKDHDHDLNSLNPTLFINSLTDPDTDNTQWISFQHNKSDGIIETGVGELKLNTNFTLADKITFRLGEIIDNLKNGWIRVDGNLNVTGNATFNDRVGIGTSSPDEELHIAAQIPTLKLEDLGAGGNLDIGTFWVGDEFSFRVDQSTEANVAMHFDSLSNVGIGTTNPSAKLHVEGDAIFDTDSGNDPFYLTRLGALTEALKISVEDSVVKFTTIQDETGSGGEGSIVFELDTGATPYYDFRAGGTGLMRIQEDGKVGIGTTDPATTLDVQGNISITNDSRLYFDGGVNTYEVFNGTCLNTYVQGTLVQSIGCA